MWSQVEQALNQSATRVITGFVSLLPGLVALIVALLISVLLAWVAGLLIRRSLRGIDFDGMLVRWGWSGVSGVSSAQSPTLVVSRLVSWSIVFLGFLIGVAAFDATLTSRLVGQLLAYLPNALAAILLLLAGNVVARFLARSVLIGAVNMNLQYAGLLSVGVKWLVLVLTTAMVLNHLGVGGKIVDEAFTILFGGIVLALALAVGLGAKDLVSRSLERQASRAAEETEEHFHHL